MQIQNNSNGYHISEVPRGLSGALRDIPGARWTGSFWAITYLSDDPVHVSYVDNQVAKLEKKYAKLREASIRDAPQITGEIPPLPELTVPIPVRRPLYGYQEPGVAYVLEKERVIIGDQPGLGKTTQAAAALLAGRTVADVQTIPALIICPTTIKRKWQRELLEVSGYKALILSDKFKASWPKYIRAGLVDAVIVNYESLRKYFVQAITAPDGEGFRLKDVVFRPEIQLFKTVIIDESHKCKDYETQQAKFVKGICEGKRYIWELTGTPLVNSPEDLIAQISILGRLKEFGGLSYFKARYCLKKEIVDVRGIKTKIYPNLDELNYFLCTRCYYRREKKVVLKDLPDKTRQVIQVDITNRSEYDKAEANFEQYLKTYKSCTDADIRRKLRARFLVQLGTLGEIAARGKLQAVKEWGDNLVESGEKIIMFCTLQDIIQSVKSLWPNCLEISGRVTGDQRDKNVRLFQENPSRMQIVCNIKAGGVGIDLYAASNVGFIELPWHNADVEQCEDRAHRNGQKSAVLSALFVGVDTVDEYRWGKIKEKREIANRVHGAGEEILEEEIDGLLSFFARRKKSKPAELFA